MSRRVAADKRPKKQNLHTCPVCPFRERGPEVLKGQGEYSRRSGDASDRPAWARNGCRVAETECLPSMLPRPDEVPCVVKLQKRPFIKNIHNVFIDSYYPKLQAAFSECENSGRSVSSNADAISKILASEKLGLGDSLASNSRAAWGKGRNYSAEGAARKPFRHRPQLSTYRDIKSPDRTTPGQSSRSRLNLDSKTYTVFSCVSDIDSTTGKAGDGKGDGRERRWSAADECEKKAKEAKGLGRTESPFAVDWFAQLCTRIETLEELLQQNLVNSFQLKEYKCSESDPKSEKCKTKTLVPKASKPISDGTSKACEGTIAEDEDGGNEIEDTDSEVRNIKERVKALEMKLQKTKISDFLNSAKPFADSNDSLTAKSTTMLSEMGTGEECPWGRWGFTGGSEGGSTGLRRHTCTFSSTCGSRLRGTRSGGKSEEEETDEKTGGKVKNKLVAKCRRIREICNSVVSSSRESSQAFKVCKACNEVSYEQAIVTKEFLETFSRHTPFAISAQVDPDKKKSATLVYLKCQQETLAPIRGCRKRYRKKRKDLCRKTALMNFTLKKVDKSQQWEEISLRKEGSECGFAGGGECETEKQVQSREFEEIWTRGAAFGWARHSCRGPCTGDSRPRPLRPEHGHRKNGNCECGLKKRKNRKKSCPSRSPMEILKRGGQIKIPVLFKEVCKPEEPSQKVSNISIKFVLVEEDTKHPLRKLINKLSQKNSGRKEQYVFGVSKCCCGDEAVLAL